MTIPVPSRDEMLVADLPIEVVSASIVPSKDGFPVKLGTVTRRHRTKAEAEAFGTAERAVLDASLKQWRSP